MSLAQTPPGLPLARRLPAGLACRGQPAGVCLASARSAMRSAAAPTGGHDRLYIGADAILPLFCPTDLHRAESTCTTPERAICLTSADQSEHDPGERCRTALGESHPADCRRVSRRDGEAVQVVDLAEDYPAPAATIPPTAAAPSVSVCKARSVRNPPIRQSKTAVGSGIPCEDRSHLRAATNRSRASSPSSNA
jgi:hypothetical protein